VIDVKYVNPLVMFLSNVILKSIAVSIKHLRFDRANKAFCSDVILNEFLLVSQGAKSVNDDSKHNFS